MSIHVWMPHGAGSSFERHLREVVENCVRLTVGDSIPAEPYEVLVAGRPDATWIHPRLERVIIPFAGVPPTTLEVLRDHPEIHLHNLHHNAAPTAEHAVALVLAAARGIVPVDQALRQGNWTPRYEEGTRGLLLEGRRALVVGYGEIGRRVGRALAGLGMEIVGIRRGNSEKTLDRALGDAHVVVVSVPSTKETRGLFDAERLARMRPEVVLVNVARGDVFDERALYEALASRRIAAAGLDVWWRYPTDEASRSNTAPSAFDFGSLENVVLSPHRAGHTDRTEALRATHLAALLNALGRGDEPPRAIDREAGY